MTRMKNNPFITRTSENSDDAWVQALKNLDKSAVHSKERDDSLYTQINSIMNGKSKYPSVAAAVEDMKERSGLTKYLDTLNKTSKEEKKQKIVNALNKITAAVNEDLKKKASIEDQEFLQSLQINSWFEIQTKIKEELYNLELDQYFTQGNHDFILDGDFAQKLRELQDIEITIVLENDELTFNINDVYNLVVDVGDINKIVEESSSNLTISIKNLVEQREKSYKTNDNIKLNNYDYDTTVDDFLSYFEDETARDDVEGFLNTSFDLIDKFTSKDISDIEQLLITLDNLYQICEEDHLEELQNIFSRFGIENLKSFINYLRAYESYVKNIEYIIVHSMSDDSEDQYNKMIEKFNNYLQQIKLVYDKFPDSCKNGLNKTISNFIIENNLQTKENKSIIKPTNKNDIITYLSKKICALGKAKNFNEAMGQVKFLKNELQFLSSKDNKILNKYFQLLQDFSGYDEELELFLDIENLDKFSFDLHNYILSLQNFTIENLNDLEYYYALLPEITHNGFPKNIENIIAKSKSATANYKLRKKAQQTPTIIQKRPDILDTIENYIRDTKGTLPIPAILERIKEIHLSDVPDTQDWEEESLLRLISKLNLQAKSTQSNTKSHSNLGRLQNYTNMSDIDASNLDPFNALNVAKL